MAETAAIVAAVLAALKEQQGDREGNSDKGKLDERQYRRVDKFDGDESKFKEWRMDILIATRSVNKKVAEKLEQIESMAIDVTGDVIEADTANEPWQKDFGKRGKELFEVLYMLTSDSAKLLIRDTPSADGFAAWQLINRAYSRKTLARTLRAYQEVNAPAQAKENHEIIAKIAVWEAKWRELQRTEGVVLPEMIKMAGMTQIVTAEVKDLVYQHVDAHQDYAKLKEKIISWVNNKVEAAKVSPVGMDVGCVDKGGCGAREEVEDEWREIDMMGKCYSCGGVGHPARLCPTKGSGKSGGGKGGGGKGYQGGSYKGGGKGDGGKGGGGKGYQGSCWTCGMKGHKSAECRRGAPQGKGAGTFGLWAEEEETSQQVVPVGGVWFMGNVETVYEHKNMFKELEQQHEQVVEEEENHNNFQDVVHNSKPKKTKKRIWKLLKFDEEKKPKEKEAQVRIQRDNISERLICVAEKVDHGICAMQFHVTDASKYLASVNRLVEAGNEVVFGKGAGNSYIKNKATGSKANMVEDNGIYVLEVMFIEGNVAHQGKIVVDSGAAENVMPSDVLKGTEMKPKTPGIRFVAANGKEMNNYGRKQVHFVPREFWEADPSGFHGRA